jgi:Holliday junction resolvase Gen1 C-terminal domain
MGNSKHVIKNADGRVDGNHSTIYTSADILANPSVQLTRGGLILIGLLSGGDYHPAGLSRCGPGIAHGLAKSGLGDELLEAAQSLTRAELADFLATWRQALRDELRTNSHGHLGSKKPSLAKAVPDSFPDVDVLLSYINPIISATDAGARRTHTPPRWEREPDLAKIAHVCELHFEWGLRDVIIKRFRTVLWPSIVLRALRRSTLEAAAAATVTVLPSTPVRDNESHQDVMGSPSKLLARHFSSIDLGGDDDLGDLIVKIHGSRTHAYTDGILEYRLEIAPASLVRLASAGIQGLRKPADTTYDVQPSESNEESEDLDDEEGAGTSGKKKKKRRGGGPPPEPDSHLRVWMPACMVRLAHPELVREYEAALEAKRAKKSSRGTRGRTKNANGALTLSKKVGKKAKAKAAPVPSTDDAECFDLDVVGTSSEEERSSSPLPLGIHSRPSHMTSSQYDQTAAVHHRTDSVFTHCHDDQVLSSERLSQLSSPSKVLQRLDRNLDGEQHLHVPPDQVAPASPPLTSSVKALQPFPIVYEEEEESNSDDDRYDVPSAPSQPTPSTPTRSRILLARPKLLPIAHEEEEEFSDDDPDTVPAELPIATWTQRPQPYFISPATLVTTTKPMEEENVDDVDKDASSFLLPLPDLKRSPHRRHSPRPPCCSPSKKARRETTREVSADRRSPSISPSPSSSDMFTLDKGAQPCSRVVVIGPQQQATTRTKGKEPAAVAAAAAAAADMSVISISSSDSDPNFDDFLGLPNGGGSDSGSESSSDDDDGGGVLPPLLIARSRRGGLSSQRRQRRSLAEDATAIAASAATAAGRDVGCEVIDLT